MATAPEKIRSALALSMGDLPDRYVLIFDRKLSPYYGWLFPEGPSRVNIGICYEDVRHEKNARVLFQAFLDKHYKTRIAAGVQAGPFKGHPISYCYSLGPLYEKGRVVIGEAGRMTHPATAEGIYQGMWSGMLAAKALAGALQGEAEKAAFGAYQAACRKQFQTGFQAARLWRGAMRTPLLDCFARIVQTPAARNMLAGLMAEM